MRNYLIVAMFAASLADAAFGNYEEQRNLNLDATGIEALQIEAGAGHLDVTGVPGLDRIVVKAIVRVPNSDFDGARDRIDLDLVLNLERQRDVAALVARFDDSRWHWGGAPSVDLQVRMPPRIALDVRDGAGRVSVSNVEGDIDIEDAPGIAGRADRRN